MKTIIEHETVIELLEIDVKYALGSYSRPLVYKAIGSVEMSWNLGVITKEEYFAFRERLIKNGLNNPEWFHKQKLV